MPALDTVAAIFASPLLLLCKDTVCPPLFINNIYPLWPSAKFVNVNVKLPLGVHLKLLLAFISKLPSLSTVKAFLCGAVKLCVTSVFAVSLSKACTSDPIANPKLALAVDPLSATKLLPSPTIKLPFVTASPATSCNCASSLALATVPDN